VEAWLNSVSVNSCLKDRAHVPAWLCEAVCHIVASAESPALRTKAIHDLLPVSIHGSEKSMTIAAFLMRDCFRRIYGDRSQADALSNSENCELVFHAHLLCTQRVNLESLSLPSPVVETLLSAMNLHSIGCQTLSQVLATRLQRHVCRRKMTRLCTRVLQVAARRYLAQGLADSPLRSEFSAESHAIHSRNNTDQDEGGQDDSLSEDPDFPFTDACQGQPQRRPAPRDESSEIEQFSKRRPPSQSHEHPRDTLNPEHKGAFTTLLAAAHISKQHQTTKVHQGQQDAPSVQSLTNSNHNFSFKHQLASTSTSSSAANHISHLLPASAFRDLSKPPSANAQDFPPSLSRASYPAPLAHYASASTCAPPVSDLTTTAARTQALLSLPALAPQLWPTNVDIWSLAFPASGPPSLAPPTQQAYSWLNHSAQSASPFSLSQPLQNNSFWPLFAPPAKESMTSEAASLRELGVR
jgi:hypothetical protein